MTYAGSNGHIRFDLEKLGQGQMITLMKNMACSWVSIDARA